MNGDYRSKYYTEEGLTIREILVDRAGDMGDPVQVGQSGLGIGARR